MEQHNRFKDAPWFPKNEEISVIVGGAGGIGSWLTVLLARAGFSPIVYDFDRIEVHNLGGQLFSHDDINKFKTQAVYKMVNLLCGVSVNTFNEPINLDTPTHHFMFSAFDNMKARKEMFEVWKKSIEHCTVIPVFIDGRLEMEQLQIFCVTPDTIEEYEKHLFDDSEVPDAPCTMRQTSHTAALIAATMVSFFTNHITNMYEKKHVRFVPFYYELFIPLMLTEIR